MNVNELANAINTELARYGNEVGKALDEVSLELAKEGVKLLKQNSPKQYGRYAKGWRLKKESSRKGRQREFMRYVIHNKTDYQLTHLLEKGHVIKNGTGREYGDTQPKIHIQLVEDNIVNQIESKLASAVGGR